MDTAFRNKPRFVELSLTNGETEPLTQRHKIRLSHLRNIGWSLWDPIGLMGPGQKWDDDDCQAFADEYDSYLLQAAGQLRKGTPEAEVAAYLTDIEAERMGLGLRPDALTRANSVVAAILADDQLWVCSNN